MLDWHAIEREAEFRRLEWERAAAADARVALACVKRTKPWQLQLPHLSLSNPKLKRLTVPGLSLVTSIVSRQNASKTYSTVKSC